MLRGFFTGTTLMLALAAAPAWAQSANPADAYTPEQVRDALIRTINGFKPGGIHDTGLGLVIFARGREAQLEGYPLQRAEAAGPCAIRLILGPSWNGGKRSEAIADFARMAEIDAGFQQVYYALDGDKRLIYDINSQGAASVGLPIMTFARTLHAKCRPPKN